MSKRTILEQGGGKAKLMIAAKLGVPWVAKNLIAAEGCVVEDIRVLFAIR